MRFIVIIISILGNVSTIIDFWFTLRKFMKWLRRRSKQTKTTL
ncbi:hypothetical protein [Paenibacillus sp. SI8]